MVYALGLEDQLVGITHECDYPPAARGKQVVVKNALPVERMTQAEIDIAVADRIRSGRSLYQVDEEMLRELRPDFILTQNLCQVCAPSGNEVSQVLQVLTNKPQIIWMSPRSLAEIFENVRELGQATGRLAEAQNLITAARERLDQIRRLTTNAARVRVFCMEWLDPVYCSGHWMPEMVEIAGGIDQLGRKNDDSIRIEWREVIEYAPEVLIITPCGFNLDKVLEQSAMLPSYPDWSNLPAVRNGRVYAVDANSYFARPSLRVVEGTELLAHLIHPELFGWNGPRDAYSRIA